MRATFAELHHRPSPQMWAGIEDLALCLQRMAEGEAEASFSLSSLDPGVGKTQTVVHFLRTLLASERHQDVGVIVFFFTKKQIEDIVQAAGLRPTDFSVVVTDDEASEYKLTQLGSDTPDQTRVVFTTQQRVQLLCREKPFAQVAQYQFQGLPRRVRIWDEGLLPAQHVCVNHAHIGGLYPTLNNISSDMVSELDQLRETLRELPDRTIIDVPDLASAKGVSLGRVLDAMSPKRPEIEKIAVDLWALFGRKAVVCNDGMKGQTLVSIRDSVPADIAPMVILDASGRVRNAYRRWPESFVRLHRLNSAPKRYDQLTCHVWTIGSGQTAYNDAEDRQVRCNGILEAINSKPSEPWLVVCHKKHRETIAKDIAALVHGDPGRITYLHWGIHRASNGYAEISNIVLAGLQYLSSSGYEGVGRAASRCHPDDCILSGDSLPELKDGELADSILQAVCRGMPRKAINDGCPPSQVYILGSVQSRVKALLPRIFPGCTVEDWEPVRRRFLPKDQRALDFICQWCLANPEQPLPSKDVMKMVEEKDRHNFGRRRRRPGFRRALSEQDIYETRYGAIGVAFVYRPEEVADGKTAADYGFVDEPEDEQETPSDADAQGSP